MDFPMTTCAAPPSHLQKVNPAVSLRSGGKYNTKGACIQAKLLWLLGKGAAGESGRVEGLRRRAWEINFPLAARVQAVVNHKA